LGKSNEAIRFVEEASSMKQHNIMVKSLNESEILRVKEKSEEIFLPSMATRIIGPTDQGYFSFFIASDNGKEVGKYNNKQGLILRNRFIDWLNSNSNNYLIDWIEIEFDDTTHHSKTLREFNC